MSTVVTVALLVMGVGMAVMLAAQVEFARQISDVRNASSIGAKPSVLPLKHDRSPLSTDLLPTSDALDRSRSQLFFVSGSCYTCEGIAALVLGSFPESAWVVLDAGHPLVEGRPLASLVKEAGSRVIRDGNDLAEALGVDVTPSVVVLESRVPVSGFVVSTAQQFQDIANPHLELSAIADQPLFVPHAEGVIS